ncbi:helix-turn-helix transcriptional regulator [Brachybacterium tyrofermentans]|uniref:helix-turn-helix transcriptional regulator n=1 Tax=Brachybacterium tyrofermentans TaxID=47848 RepID=UPI00269ABF47
MCEPANSFQSESEVPTRAALATAQAAEYLSLPKGTLEVWRSRGEGPPYVRLGRSVRYRIATLDAYLLAHEHGGSAA